MRGLLLATVISDLKNIFITKDIADCVSFVIIGDFIETDSIDTMRELTSKSTEQGLIQKGNAENQQNSSLFLSFLSFYIKCIPIIPFAREIKWNKLIELLIKSRSVISYTNNWIFNSTYDNRSEPPSTQVTLALKIFAGCM